MPNTTNPRERARALTAAQSTPVLITSLRALAEPESAEERLVRAWVIDELETRFPAAAAAVGAAFDADEELLSAGEDTPGVDYVAVLLAHIPDA